MFLQTSLQSNFWLTSLQKHFWSVEDFEKNHYKKWNFCMGDLGGYGIAELPPAVPFLPAGPTGPLGKKGTVKNRV